MSPELSRGLSRRPSEASGLSVAHPVASLSQPRSGSSRYRSRGCRVANDPRDTTVPPPYVGGLSCRGIAREVHP